MPFILLLLAIPVGEVFIFLEVGSVIGTWPTIGLIVGTAVVGGMILRWQGLQTLARARRQLAANRLPVAEMAEGAALALGGGAAAHARLLHRCAGDSAAVPAAPPQPAAPADCPARAACPPGGADAASGADGARVIEGEYTVLDDAPEPGPPGARPNGGNR